MNRKHIDGLLRGYIDREGTTPTPLRARLEADPLTRVKITSPASPPLREDEKTERKIGPPPNGYEQPTTWKRVAESPEGTVLMATHEGWESVTHDLTIERKEVKYASGETKTMTHVKGPAGKIYWRGTALDDVKLPSLRVPGRGDKGTEGAA